MKGKGENGMYKYNDSLLEDVKEFLGVSRLKYPDRKSSAQAVANHWRKKNPKTEKDYRVFYNKCDDYLYENIYCNMETSCKQRVVKIAEIFELKGVYKVLEVGVGVGCYAMNLSELGYRVNVTKSEDLAFRFFKYRRKKYRMEKKIRIVRPVSRYDVCLFVDVIEHTYDPYKFLSWVGSLSNILVFTQGFGVHRKDMGGYPQHSDHSMRKIKRHLESLGFYKWVPSGMSFPPHVYQKRRAK